MLKYLSNYALNKTYFSNCGPQSPSYSKMRPAETFSFQVWQVWPLDGFEFESGLRLS